MLSISILPSETCNFDNIKQVLIFEEDESDKSKTQKVIKLQKQFGHAFSRNLENLLKRAGIPLSSINDIINEVISHCKTCQQYKKPLPRPTAGLPEANYFNDTVAMDSHQLGPNL